MAKKAGDHKNTDPATAKRCLAIKSNGYICGTILNSYHADNLCYACRHRVAYNLEEPRLANMVDLLKQKGEHHGG